MIPNRLTRSMKTAGLIGAVLLVLGAVISQIEIPTVASE